MVSEGKARKAAGEPPGKDAWTRVLEPKEAIRARVVPVLRGEKARLEAVLAEVGRLSCHISLRILTPPTFQLEAENDKLTDILKANKAKRAEQNALANEWLDALEEVRSNFSGFQ